MPYSYIEHVSDVGIRAEGKALEDAFESGAEAMLNVMFNLETIEHTIKITFGADAPDLAALFVEVLNEVLSIQDRHSLAVKSLKVDEIKKPPPDTSSSERSTESRSTGKSTRSRQRSRPRPTQALNTFPRPMLRMGTATPLPRERENIDETHVFECIIDV